MRYKILLSIICLVICAGTLSIAFLPWKEPLARKLQDILEAKGFQNVRLTLSDIGFTGATLQNITIGDENPVMLKNLTLHYSAREIMKGNLRALVLSGLALEIRQQGGKWVVPGYGGGGGSDSRFALPVTPAETAAIPFDRVIINDSRVDIVMPAGRVFLPFNLEWNRANATISMQTESPSFTGEKFNAHAAHGEISAKLNPEARSWEGAWKLENVQPEAGDTGIPLMDIAGTLRAEATTVTFEGRMTGVNGARATFTLRTSLGDAPILTIASASMPWQGGRIALGRTVIPLTGVRPVKVVLKAERISVDAFMQSLTGKRVSATGIVSGALPLTIGRDGSISFDAGGLKTEGPGVISMPPELIPGGNEQVALTREILKNFHYDGLSLTVDKAEGDAISVLVAAEGRNPDVLNGRAVKLNIRLTGDLLDLVRQNAMFLREPQKILEQGRP
jgi:hypothetical protein